MLSIIKSQLSKLNYELSKSNREKYNKKLLISEVTEVFNTRDSQYKYFHNYFWNLSPNWLKEHRKYFMQKKRGFGEDAFHAMWYFLFNEFHPKNILEIGVYRGQTLSLFLLLGEKFGFETNVHGISPFSSMGDSVSKYLEQPDYYNDVIANIKNFKLPQPFLHKGFSTDDKMINVIRSRQWDLIYIDGNHNYNIAKNDFFVSSQYIKKGGLIVLDDAALYTDFKPPFYAKAGHDGPSKVASEIDNNSFKEILSVGHNRVFKKK